MKKFLMVLSLMFVAATSAQAETKSMDTSLYAVAFHADWCGSCKVLGAAMIKARGKADLDNQNVLFVKLDLTDGAKRSQSKLMASALGLEKFYAMNKGKTGFVLLVNSKTGEQLGKLTKKMDANQIISKIEDSLKAL